MKKVKLSLFLVLLMLAATTATQAQTGRPASETHEQYRARVGERIYSLHVALFHRKGKACRW